MKVLLLTSILAVSHALAQIPTPPPPTPPATPSVPGVGVVRPRVRMIPPNNNGNNNGGPVLTENLQVLLTLSDKDAPPIEVSIVTAGTNFTALVADLGLNFNGTIGVDEAGSIALTYSLAWEPAMQQVAGGTVQTKQTSSTGSVLLKAGEDVQIFRAGSRTARLVLKKSETPAAK